ncbi:hypothetical protein GGE67_006259 [Rhizobium leucaenae]|nr:hypothetical protein [Rhizobium leucaenae]
MPPVAPDLQCPRVAPSNPTERGFSSGRLSLCRRLCVPAHPRRKGHRNDPLRPRRQPFAIRGRHLNVKLAARRSDLTTGINADVEDRANGWARVCFLIHFQTRFALTPCKRQVSIPMRPAQGTTQAATGGPTIIDRKGVAHSDQQPHGKFLIFVHHKLSTSFRWTACAKEHSITEGARKFTLELQLSRNERSKLQGQPLACHVHWRKKMGRSGASCVRGEVRATIVPVRQQSETM